jgi:hypothetical protein
MEEIWHHDKVSTLCNFIRYFSVSLRNIHVEVTDNKLHHKALETRYSITHECFCWIRCTQKHKASW